MFSVVYIPSRRRTQVHKQHIRIGLVPGRAKFNSLLEGMALQWQSSGCRVEDVWALNVQIFVVRRVGSIVYMTVAVVLLVVLVAAHVDYRLVCWRICCARRRLARCPAAPRTWQSTASMGADHKSDDSKDHSTERDADCQTEANTVTRRSWRSCKSTTHIRSGIYSAVHTAGLQRWEFYFSPIKYAIPIHIRTIPIPIPISTPKLLPFPWESHGNGNSHSMHTSNPEADDFQNLISSSLSTDTSPVKFLWTEISNFTWIC